MNDTQPAIDNKIPSLFVVEGTCICFKFFTHTNTAEIILSSLNLHIRLGPRLQLPARDVHDNLSLQNSQVLLGLYTSYSS